MARGRYVCVLFLSILLFAACAPQTNRPQVPKGEVDAEAKKQKELVLREFLAMQERVQRVAWNIRYVNADLCGETLSYALGLRFVTRDDFSDILREGDVGADLHERPRVNFVARGGPADLAGIKVGDMLYAVNGEEAGTRKSARDALEESIKPGGKVSLAVKREGEIKEYLVTPVKICGYPVLLKHDPTLNAYADGKKITLLTGMLKFMRSDDELAAILGHEMAHNTQKHMRAKTGNMILGVLLVDLPVAILTGRNPNVGAQLGHQIFSQEYEAEADYVGLYYSARAGYDISNVADLWRRMAVEYPEAISMGSSHPSTSERFVALEADRDEIYRKQRAGQPLVPEMKTAQK